MLNHFFLFSFHRGSFNRFSKTLLLYTFFFLRPKLNCLLSSGIINDNSKSLPIQFYIPFHHLSFQPRWKAISLPPLLGNDIFLVSPRYSSSCSLSSSNNTRGYNERNHITSRVTELGEAHCLTSRLYLSYVVTITIATRDSKLSRASRGGGGNPRRAFIKKQSSQTACS